MDKQIVKFPTSKLANRYLTGLVGCEIGASYHNSFDLDNCINVDYTDSADTVYKKQEVELAGDYARVDVVADGANLPFENKSFDYIINSHVLEHFFSPLHAIEEWVRVAKKYLLIIVPRKDLTFDKNKPTTTLEELIGRYEGSVAKMEDSPTDDHWTIFDSASFKEFCDYVCEKYNMKIVEIEDPDRKVGNGMLVLFEIL